MNVTKRLPIGLPNISGFVITAATCIFIVIYVVSEMNYNVPSGTLRVARWLSSDLPCAASLAGIQPVRPRAQRTSP